MNAEPSATTLRRTRLDDLPFVVALERHPENSSLIGHWIDAQHLAAIEGRDRWSHWIIEEANRPAGYIISRDCRTQRAGIYVKRILVARKERGTGTRALGEFLDGLRVRGLDTNTLFVIYGDHGEAFGQH